MRRILFRRTRSDTDDKMRNTDRVSKADSVVANAGLESFHPRLAYPVPATVLEEGSTASAPVSALSRLHSVMPISPPPPYDTNQEVGRARRKEKRHWSICPIPFITLSFFFIFSLLILFPRANLFLRLLRLPAWRVHRLTNKPWPRTDPKTLTTSKGFRLWALWVPLYRPDIVTVLNVK